MIDSTLAGLGIRAELFDWALDDKPDLGFFEAHSENYFGDSIGRAKLLALRQDYPISLHGVGLSLGRADDLDRDHLQRLKHLVEAVEPALVSEHLAWSAYSHTHLPDLLPLPLTENALEIICQHIEQMQDALKRQILLENPSNYLLFDQLQIPEPEFLNRVAERTGCRLLLDVNNIMVSAKNLQRNPQDYIKTINPRFIGQYHLAGYTPVEKDGETLLIDTHNHAVYPEVWELFQQVVMLHGVHPTLFEWDSDFPDNSVLLAECQKATAILVANAKDREYRVDQPVQSIENPLIEHSPVSALGDLQQKFIENILQIDQRTPQAIDDHKPRIWVYQNNVYGAILDYLEAVFPAVVGVLGVDYFKQIARALVKTAPPQQGNIHEYGQALAEQVDQHRELKKLPYLTDLIFYEWGLHQAYYADRGCSLAFSQLSQEELLTVAVGFNSSVSLIDSMFPIYEIHRQSLPEYLGKVAINLHDSQDTLLVYKQNYQVHTKLLDADEQVFLSAIRDHDNLLQAIESVNGIIEPDVTSKILSFVFESDLLITAFDGEMSDSIIGDGVLNKCV